MLDAYWKAAVKKLRLKTEDAFTWVSTWDEGDDEANISMKMYGPFDTADEQRAFMLEVINNLDGMHESDKECYRKSIRAWVRVDEEPDYVPPPALEPSPLRPPPTPEELAEAQQRYAAMRPEERAEFDRAQNIKFYLDGLLKRTVP